MHGKGVYTWPDGRKYDGDYVDNKMHGKGVYTWPDGAKYDGDFVDDKIHGKGVYTWPNGRKYDGDYVDGQDAWQRRVYLAGWSQIRRRLCR